MNGEYIRKNAAEDFHKVASPYYSKALLDAGIDTFRLSRLLQPRTDVLSSIPDAIDFLLELPEYDISLYEHKK